MMMIALCPRQQKKRKRRDHPVCHIYTDNGENVYSCLLADLLAYSRSIAKGKRVTLSKNRRDAVTVKIILHYVNTDL